MIVVYPGFLKISACVPESIHPAHPLPHSVLLSQTRLMLALLNRSSRSSGHFQMTPRTPWPLREMEEMECPTAISLQRCPFRMWEFKKKKRKETEEVDR